MDLMVPEPGRPVEDIRTSQAPLVYTLIVNPMGNYKHEHVKKYGGTYKVAGWQGYRFNLPMVFDDEFDKYVEQALAPLARYKDDPCLLGYFTDNELPWYTDALDRHLNFLAKDERIPEHGNGLMNEKARKQPWRILPRKTVLHSPPSSSRRICRK